MADLCICSFLGYNKNLYIYYFNIKMKKLNFV